MPGSDEMGRTQPEFSLGERLARVEAEQNCQADLGENLQGQLDRRLTEIEKLFMEKLAGLRAEHQAALAAQKEAIGKVETVTDRRFENASSQAEKREGLMGQRVDALDGRVQAVERGESGSRAVGDWWVRSAAIIGGLAALGYLIYLIAQH